MTDKIREAQEAWKQLSSEQSLLAGRHNYWIGIHDFQAALKKEIEKEGYMKHEIYLNALRRVLELIDTVEPLKRE